MVLQNYQVKFYYINEERYDWLTDPRNLEKLYHGFRARIYLKELSKIPKSGCFLDAGCGTGLITTHIPPPVVGVDINLWNLKRLHSRIKDKELIQADLEYLPFRDNCFDLIICTEVLEHLPSPKKAVKEFYRVLREEGILFGTVPSIHPVWRFRRYLLTTCPVSEPFHRNYTRRQLEEVLSIFPKIEIRYFMFGLNFIFKCFKSRQRAVKFKKSWLALETLLSNKSAAFSPTCRLAYRR